MSKATSAASRIAESGDTSPIDSVDRAWARYDAAYARAQSACGG